MIAPLSDGNAGDISGRPKGTVVKDGPHVGETTNKGGSKEGVGDGMGAWIDDVDKPLSLSRRSSAEKHRPPRPAGKCYGDESSVSSLSEQSRKSPRSRSSHSPRLSQMSELKRMMAEITAMQKKMYELHDSREPPKTPGPMKPKASTGVADKTPSPAVAESPTGVAGRLVESDEAERLLTQRRNESTIRRSLEDGKPKIPEVPPLHLGNSISSAISGMYVWMAMANAEDANHDRRTALQELCINAASMSDAEDLGMSRQECMNLAQKT